MLQKMRIETVEMLFSLMNEHFILKPPRGKKWIKMGDNSFEERNNFNQKINWLGFSSNDKCILIF